MTKEDKQIIDRATKENWRTGDRTRLKHLLEKNLKLYRENVELENKIADIKANCDLAIEGRDVKIKELEQELTVEKDQHQEETNLHLHAENYIKSLEQKLEQTEKDLADFQFNYPHIKELEKENAELKKELKDANEKVVHLACNQNKDLNYKLTKATELIEDMYDKIPASHSDYYKDVMDRVRQFLKEVEK